jgi:hypothetical protein
MVFLFGKFASIDLNYSRQKQSFLEKHRDEMIIAIGSAIVGGLIVGIVLKHL